MIPQGRDRKMSSDSSQLMHGLQSQKTSHKGAGGAAASYNDQEENKVDQGTSYTKPNTLT